VIFDGFALEHVDVGSGVTLRVRYGGSGPVVVLLHGHPRTHTTWWQVAPRLAEQFTVVCPDLPGYGESTGPTTTLDHSPHSKRAMAASIATLMRQIGHDSYAVAGHDRGAYVAHRLALDFADRVRKLMIMDAVPIGAALARVDAHFAASWWHWFFLAQTDKPAERVINADPDAWYGAEPETMGQENYEDYRRAIRSPETVHAMCEDYRAGLRCRPSRRRRRSGRRPARNLPHFAALV
jgi:haloacetate dehalogenase